MVSYSRSESCYLNDSIVVNYSNFVNGVGSSISACPDCLIISGNDVLTSSDDFRDFLFAVVKGWIQYNALKSSDKAVDENSIDDLVELYLKKISN